MTTQGIHRTALEVTLSADESLADPLHSGLLALARSLADALDAQGGNPQSRTQATYAGQLGAIRRVVKDARDARRNADQTPKRASRLAAIKAQSSEVES